MSRKKDFKYLVGDFETTVYKGQEYTEVWASAIVELNTEDVIILHSLPDTLKYLIDLKTNIVIYYHNLKFDGAFWVDFLLKSGYTLAVESTGESMFQCEWIPDSKMKHKTFKLSISDMGMWYTVKIKHRDKLIEIRDSLKLLPFSVREIGKSFATKHKKLDMEYLGFRYAGCEITDEEKKYIANDVLVVKEALEIMFKQGHNKLTIGACCLSEYKLLLGGKDIFDNSFPNLYEIPAPEGTEQLSAGDYIRKSYKGGWCYLAKGKSKRLLTNGVT